MEGLGEEVLRNSIQIMGGGGFSSPPFFITRKRTYIIFQSIRENSPLRGKTTINVTHYFETALF